MRRSAWLMAATMLAGCAKSPGAGMIGEGDPELCSGLVTVPDEALRNALLAELPERDEDMDGELEIWAEDLRKLTGIAAPRLGIVDLRGLECAQQMRTLGLAGNDIVDIGPLVALKELHELELSENDVTDLTPLAGLERLEKLSLDLNGISDIGPLLDLTELTYLDLGRNEVSDLSPLTQMVQLESLVLSDNGVSDVAPLEALTGLVSLELDRNEVANIAPLAALTGLTFLDLDQNEVGTLVPLAGLVNLVDLEATGNLLISLEGLEGMSKLVRVVAQANQIASTKGLSNKPALITVDLSNNAVTDISEVASMPELRVLQIAINKVADISPVSGLPVLRNLDVRWNEGLIDLGPVATLDGLQWFGAGGMDISQDISPLAGRDQLRTFVYQESGPTDFSVLGGLPSLVTVNLEGTPLDATALAQVGAAVLVQSLIVTRSEITDMSPLAGMVDLENLTAETGEFTSIEVAANWPKLINVKLSGGVLDSLVGFETQEKMSLLDISDTPVADLTPLVQNETFRTNDVLEATGTALDEGDCGDIAIIEERMATVEVDFECP